MGGAFRGSAAQAARAQGTWQAAPLLPRGQNARSFQQIFVQAQQRVMSRAAAALTSHRNQHSSQAHSHHTHMVASVAASDTASSSFMEKRECAYAS